MFKVIFKGSAGEVVARDMLPGIAAIAEDGVAVKLVIVKGTDTLDRVRFLLAVGEGRGDAMVVFDGR